ncbi:hypothetical protein ACP4OV_016543 [Aristida adscensionis]
MATRRQPRPSPRAATPHPAHRDAPSSPPRLARPYPRRRSLCSGGPPRSVDRCAPSP